MKIAKKIHLVIDRSKNSDRATDQAVMMARKLEADLSSLYVVNTHMYQTPKVIGAMLRTGKKHLKIVKDNEKDMHLLAKTIQAEEVLERSQINYLLEHGELPNVEISSQYTNEELEEIAQPKEENSVDGNNKQDINKKEDSKNDK